MPCLSRIVVRYKRCWKKKCMGFARGAGKGLGIVGIPERIPAELPDLLDKYRQPFLATDRNVMNLPGIGKSMTYQTVGMTKEGKRILRFSLDARRRHSPKWITRGDLYRGEQVDRGLFAPIASVRERVEDYCSLWDYSGRAHGIPLCPFEYPEPRIEITGISRI